MGVDRLAVKMCRPEFPAVDGFHGGSGQRQGGYNSRPATGNNSNGQRQSNYNARPGAANNTGSAEGSSYNRNSNDGQRQGASNNAGGAEGSSVGNNNTPPSNGDARRRRPTGRYMQR